MSPLALSPRFSPARTRPDPGGPRRSLSRPLPASRGLSAWTVTDAQMRRGRRNHLTKPRQIPFGTPRPTSSPHTRAGALQTPHGHFSQPTPP